jgi:pimeloyl-ACP methyl ester carboxylesterase
MNNLAQILRPTLVRRVMLTLLCTAALAWVVLLAYYYQRETGQHAVDAFQRDRAGALSAALAKIAPPEQARTAAAFAADLLNSSSRQAGRPQPILLQLEDLQGRRLYPPPESTAAVLHGEPGRFVEQQLHGANYHVLRIDSARWRLLLGEARSSDSWLLARLSRDLALSVLISFPFVLLPTWFAVARGLRPLRQLSSSIAKRGPDDLAPLAVAPTYAELAPVTTALDRLFGQLRSKIAREHAFVHDAAPEFLGFAFTPASLAQLQLPLQLWSGGKDVVVPFASNGQTLQQALGAKLDWQPVADAAHYSFLVPCSGLAKLLAPAQLCSDPAGFDRQAFHRDMNASVAAFFAAHL